MSRKTELINVFHEIKSHWENTEKKIKEINEDYTYSEEYKKEWTEDALKKLLPVVQAYHDRALDIINSAMNELSNKWRRNGIGRLSDGGYQAGLSNVIKMLEMGAIVERTDVEDIIAMYSEDSNAMAAIRQILVNCDNRILRDCILLIPEDHREKNKELLERLKGNVDQYINVNLVCTILDSWKFNYGLSGVLLSIDGMEQFVKDRLDNNLELLH